MLQVNASPKPGVKTESFDRPVGLGTALPSLLQLPLKRKPGMRGLGGPCLDL